MTRDLHLTLSLPRLGDVTGWPHAHERVHLHAERLLDPERHVTGAILTTAPNALLASFHDCSPIIIPPEHFAAWLDPATPAADLASLLAPHPSDALTAGKIERPSAPPGRS